MDTEDLDNKLVHSISTGTAMVPGWAKVFHRRLSFFWMFMTCLYETAMYALYWMPT
jgi:hypothetical protein